MKLRNRGSKNLENVTNMDTKNKPTTSKRIQKKPEKIKKEPVAKIKEVVENNETSEYFSTTTKIAKSKNRKKTKKVKDEPPNEIISQAEISLETKINKKETIKSPKIETKSPKKTNPTDIEQKNDIVFNQIPKTEENLSSDSEFEEVENIKVVNNNLPRSAFYNQIEPPKPEIDENKSKAISENIDNMLRLEKITHFETNKKNTEVDMMDDDESDLEEVEMKEELNISSLKNREPIEINVASGKTNKKVNYAAKMARMLKALQKQLGIDILKAHLTCWIAHGFYLNELCLSDEVRGTALSLLEKFKFEKFQLVNFDLNTLKTLLKEFKKKIELSELESGFLKNNILITNETLCEAMRIMKCSSYLQFILIILVFLRNANVKVRLCVSFDAYELHEESKKAQNLLKTEQNKSLPKKSAPVKRKSNTIEVESKDTDTKKTTTSKAAKSNEKKRISGKLSKLDDEGFSESDSSFIGDEEISSSDSESPKKKSKKKPKAKIVKKKKTKEKANQNADTKEIIDISPEDDEENNIKTRETSFRNYWLEVYLKNEGSWQPIDVMEKSFDCKPDHFEKRFENQMLYVCGFDNDNKIKEVTKRYASKWSTITRLLRVDFVEKKLWWERTLMFHQTVDVDLDIEEEKKLKKMLLDQGLPSSVSEFKDHPLYVLKRHLLKFQSIYPEKAKPVGHFRNEAVFSRNNHATLHSRQTWLKYARSVKPYEKPYKIVKGRIKQSDYKNGCRENPDLDTFGWWQTKPYDVPYAEHGRIPLNEFGNVELFQPCMLPIGTVYLKNMPNLNRVCRKLKVDCAAAVVGFDAHGGFSHAVYGGWVVCEEHKEAVIAAYQEEEARNNKKLIEKQQERVWGNWKKLIRGLEIRERIKLKYGTEDTEGYKISQAQIVVSDDEAEEINKKKVIKKIATSSALDVDDDHDEPENPKLIKKVIKPKPKVTKSKTKRSKKNASESEYEEDEQNDDDGEYVIPAKKKRVSINKSASRAKETEKPEKKDIFDKISSQNLIENEKNSEKSESVVNNDDDLMLSEEDD